MLDIVLFVVSTDPAWPDLNVSSLQCGLLSPAHSSRMSGPCRLFPLRSSSLRWAESVLRAEPMGLQHFCVRPHQLSLTDGWTFQMKVQHTPCDMVMINTWSVYAKTTYGCTLMEKFQFTFIPYIRILHIQYIRSLTPHSLNRFFEYAGENNSKHNIVANMSSNSCLFTHLAQNISLHLEFCIWLHGELKLNIDSLFSTALFSTNSLGKYPSL